jgi:hypothetical protein
MGVRTMRRMDAGVKRGMMCRSGIARGLPIEVNRALSANRCHLLGFVSFFFGRCPIIGGEAATSGGSWKG